jgi:hypothetical protein
MGPAYTSAPVSHTSAISLLSEEKNIGSADVEP